MFPSFNFHPLSGGPGASRAKRISQCDFYTWKVDGVDEFYVWGRSYKILWILRKHYPSLFNLRDFG